LRVQRKLSYFPLAFTASDWCLSDYCLLAQAAAVTIPAGFYFDDTLQSGVPSADIARYLPALGYTLIFLMGMFVAAVMIAITTVVSFRRHVFPTWFNWLSLLCAVALLFAAPFTILSLALLIWVVGASLYLLRSPFTVNPG
jgi:hypothetical protein